MAEFYHVDRTGDLGVGSVLELEFPGRFTNSQVTVPDDENLEVLREWYPAGVSRHGARYAAANLISKEESSLESGWEAMIGVLDLHDVDSGDRSKFGVPSYVLVYEICFELMRMLEFEDELSRFQAYFGFEDFADAVDFSDSYRGSNDDSKIVRVVCDDFDVRDMELVEMSHFGHIFSYGRQYWRGEAGSSDPVWEVLMEPPVEVVDVVS